MRENEVEPSLSEVLTVAVSYGMRLKKIDADGQICMECGDVIYLFHAIGVFIKPCYENCLGGDSYFCEACIDEAGILFQ